MNLPNLITVMRILLVPVNVWLLISEEYRAALLVFCLASASDAVDGWLARMTNTKTVVGAHLDPLADKLLLVSSYAALGIAKLIPTWLAIIVISRDVLILGGLMLSWFMDNPVEVKPLFISKANTLAQILFLALALYALAFSLVPPALLTAAAAGVSALTLLSGLAYMRDWFAHMNGNAT